MILCIPRQAALIRIYTYIHVQYRQTISFTLNTTDMVVVMVTWHAHSGIFLLSKIGSFSKIEQSQKTQEDIRYGMMKRLNWSFSCFLLCSCSQRITFFLHTSIIYYWTRRKLSPHYSLTLSFFAFYTWEWSKAPILPFLTCERKEEEQSDLNQVKSQGKSRSTNYF